LLPQTYYRLTTSSIFPYTTLFRSHFTVINLTAFSVHLGEVTRNSTLAESLHSDNDHSLPNSVVDTSDSVGSVLKLVLVVLVLKNSHRNTASLYSVLLLPPDPALTDKTA